MPRVLNRLTALKIDRQKDGTTFCDGGGLYCVADGGSKRWTFRYTLHGRKREMGGGSSDTFSLVEAREWAREMRQLVHRGIDPIESRKEAKAAKKAEQAKVMTFEECATAYLGAQGGKWTNAKHAGQWSSTLEQYAYPTLGKLPVALIETPHIVKVLEPIWKTIPETASRLRGRIEKVLGWATVSGFRTGDNPARWRSHLQELFLTKAAPAHHAALPYKELPAFWAKLRGTDSVQACALAFTILVAARRDEVRLATWSEIDFGERLWTIAGERMKARKPHKVPLCGEAMRLLERMRPLRRADDFIFPGATHGRPLSPETMPRLVKDLAGQDVTLHGFRSAFTDWAHETTSFPEAVIDLALAHTVSDKVQAAYRRGELREKRRKLAETWASFLNRPASESSAVVPMRRGA